MKFSLTTRDPYNADFYISEGEVAQVIYRTRSPFKFKHRHATIDKIVTATVDGSSPSYYHSILLKT